MKSIYETKSYKLILSYHTNTKLHKNNVFSKMITFNIVEFDINNYLFAHAMYYNKKKTIAVEYNLNMPVPREIEESISKMRYTTNTVEQLYTYLWNDIKKKDYIKFK